MDLQALISRFRTLAGDHGVPPLWSDADVTDWLNEAEREAAERARLILDKTTEDVTTYPLLVDTRDYTLHPKVFDVERVKLERAGSTGDHLYPVERSSAADMAWTINNRPNLSGWADYFDVYGEQSGDGAEGKRLVIDRRPTEVGGFIYIEAYRWPLIDMEDPGDEPEIGPRHHDGLVDWALHKAYLVRDIEGSAPGRSDKHLGMFIDRFGQREDANVQRKHLRHRAGRVRMSRW